MRTDAQLLHDVAAELAWEPLVDAALIGVEVHDGVVSLAGHPGGCRAQWAALQAVGRIAGMRALVSALEVALPPADRRDDAAIVAAVERVLRWVTTLPAGAVHAQVDAGWITLSGEVDWDYQRQVAADVVRCLVGVAGVSDSITLRAAA